MQVSTIAELDTHAVIGGGEAKAFGMDDSAELYALLSDKIYRDKKRAAMRETICNAWDAHIMVGKTDVPVDITVSETEIKIRDFGPGIPEEMLHPIYCIYGKSTKVADEKQTGGFGLGSKSPFAVTDHFNIANHHEGFKTVHSISRGGAVSGGKPEMREMVRVPTTESGLLVTIPIHNARDRYEFETHIRAVVKQGGMLATLNGVPLERIDFSEARKHEFCVIPHTGFNEGRVYVLYGTVMYPLTNTDTKMTLLADQAIKHCGSQSTLVLIPPPNSIGVTPSREALSFSELTDSTLYRLLDKAIQKISQAIGPAKKRALFSVVEKRKRTELDHYIAPTSHYPIGILSTPDMIADHAVRSNGQHHIWHGDTKRTIYKIAQRLYPEDRRFYRRGCNRYESVSAFNFKRTSMPLLRMASKMGLLKDLMLFDIHSHRYDNPGAKTRRIGEFEGVGHVHPVLCVARNMRDLRPMLAIEGRTFHGPDKGTYIGGLVMRQWTEKNFKLLEELCGHFKIRLEKFDYEEAKRNKPKPVKRKVEAEKFFVLEDIDEKTRDRDRLPSCETPKFYLTTWQRNEQPHIPFSAAYVGLIRSMFPQTALITTKAQDEKLKKMGCRNLAEVAAERLTELTKVREVVYGEIIRHGRVYRESNWDDDDSVARTVVKLIKQDMRIAKLLFPDRATPGDRHREAALIWDFLTGIENISVEAAVAVKEAKEGLQKACSKLIKPVSGNEMHKRFGYLAPLRGADIIGSSYYDAKSDSGAALVETVKFLQRRRKTQEKAAAKPRVIDIATIIPAATAANTLKEAA